MFTNALFGCFVALSTLIPQVKSQLVQIGLTPAEKQQILDWHNEQRESTNFIWLV